MPNLKNTTNPQLCMLIPERKYMTLQSMGVLLKLRGCLTTKLNRSTCGYFKSSHKTLLVVILWGLSFSVSLFLTHARARTHTQTHIHNPLPTIQTYPTTNSGFSLFSCSIYYFCFKIFNTFQYLLPNEFLKCLGIKVQHSFSPHLHISACHFSITLVLHFNFVYS